MNQSLVSPSHQFIRLTGATSSLLPAVEELYRAFAQHERITTPIDQFIDFIAAHIDDEEMLVLLAVINETTVGYGLTFDVLSHPFIPTWRRCGYITHLFVSDAYQRQGIGQGLAEESLRWLTDRGVKQVMLNVDVGNTEGEQFWHKQGFEPYLLRMRRRL